MNFRKAFSLAEVLVTVAIIGVIAAETVPALVQTVNHKQYVAGMKQAYSSIRQAVQTILIENGRIDGYFTTENAMVDFYAEKLNFNKICYEEEKPGECWHNHYKSLDGTIRLEETKYVRAISSNGMLFEIDDDTDSDGNCKSDMFVRDGENIACGKMRVDINGFKGPNINGRDIFIFRITSIGVFPSGVEGENYDDWSKYCSLSASNSSNGNGCAGRIMVEGGMNY